ncbi:MAG TPA: flagellar FlbD family protein [Blastocatellia bacterium]|nr:flagellar FlbD family protein [Blastocatellia bacterium]
MIHLTRLNERALVLNSDLIEFIENAPDTVITLITGDKLVVRESADQIVEMILQFRRRLLPTSFAVLPPILDPPPQKGSGGKSE